MSRRDFDQKLEMRRAFWALGASTRMEVKLGTLVDPRQNRADRQEWTDLDVVAVHYSHLTGLTHTIADCKTIRGRVSERIFWLRGVMDLLGARSAYLVRDDSLPAAARQLALRLSVTAMDKADREAFLNDLPTAALPAKGGFLEAATVERWEQSLRGMPQSLTRLNRYRETGFWIAPGHRNLTALPAQLRAASDFFRSPSSWRLALTIDLAWLYLVACLRAVEDMAKLHMSDLGAGLGQVVVGDERERRDKEYLAEQLKVLFSLLPKRRGPPPPVEIYPAYYDELADLMFRLSRRRGEASEALRVLEFTSVETVAAGGARWVEAFPDHDPRTAKLASDVVRFIVRACDLPRDLLETFDEMTSGGTLAAVTDGPNSGPGSQPHKPTDPSQIRLFEANTPHEEAKP